MTDKYVPDNGGGNGGTIQPTVPRATNFYDNSFNFKNADGQVIKTIPLDDNRQARYVTTVGSKGINNITGNYSGNRKSDVSTFHATDANGNGGTSSIAGTVNQIIAGDGIYISAPNGQGVVTISTSPVALTQTTLNIRNIAWTKRIDNLDSKFPSQFIAVGDGGVNMRSRDGHNWVRLPGSTNISISEVVCIGSTSVLDNHIEYWGYCSVAGTNNLRNRLVYGRLGNTGTNTDGMITYNDTALSDQNGVIADDLTALNGFISSGNTIQYFTGGYNGGIWIGQPTLTNLLLTKETNPLLSVGAFASNATTASSSYIVLAVGVGAGVGQIVRSSRTGTSGGTWSSVHTDATAQVYQGIAYNNGNWVAVGWGNRAAVSTDTTTWTDSNGAIKGAQWYDIAYGNGNYVACGQYTVDSTDYGCIMYSADGITWTKANAGTSEPLRKIEYSPELNIFVAVGLNGAIVSVDG